MAWPDKLAIFRPLRRLACSGPGDAPRASDRGGRGLEENRGTTWHGHLGPSWPCAALDSARPRAAVPRI